MIIIKQLQMNLISALNNPSGGDIPLNKLLNFELKIKKRLGKH